MDWIALGFVGLSAFVGLRRGLVGASLSLAGLIGGAVVGARLASRLLGVGAEPPHITISALAGAFAGVMLLQGAASLAGSFVRGGLRLVPPLRLLDSLGGLLAGAASGLALVWVAAAVTVELPGHARLRSDVRRSELVRHLNRVVPPRKVLELRADLTRFSARASARTSAPYESSSRTEVGRR
jgi:uncharacterized membrane protein required for colicin V production